MAQKLTAREQEIVELIAWGASKKEAASKLFVSYHTVDTHLKKIYKKLGISKQTELVRWYFIKKFHLPLEMNPLQKQIIALFFLFLSIGSIMAHSDMLRPNARTNVTARATRGSRSGRRKELDIGEYC